MRAPGAAVRAAPGALPRPDGGARPGLEGGARPRPASGAGSRPGGERRRALAVIAKEPLAGIAKTRLVPALGPEGAAALAAAMLDDTLAAAARVAAERWLCFTPAPARAAMAARAPGFRLLHQVGGDLGDRLAACAAALAEQPRAGRVAVVGADTPHLPAAWYGTALDLLDHVDLVLGPALDGGYYLIAGRRLPAELFVGVPMGTDAVLEETLRRAERLRLRTGLLPPLRDLDRVEDLRAALDGGELTADRCPRTAAAVTALLASVREDAEAPAWRHPA